ncbi:MAG: hypothetical protein EA356_12865 [Geminicoccaceae bacterium]|nr:MAG: hypothetical protein EA356_12865 [Geminicoccaceae bacterium]
MTARITFRLPETRLAAEPNRMDVVCMVGFLEERRGAEWLRRTARAAADGWAERIAAQGGSLYDLPLRLQSLDEAEALFDLAGRIDRVAEVQGRGLDALVVVPPSDRHAGIALDAATQVVELPVGTIAREDLRDHLAAAFAEVEVTLGPADAQDRRPLRFVRRTQVAGTLTVHAAPVLGLPVAATARTRRVGAPLGAALRAFFRQGGREAVVIALGPPVPLFADETSRVAALGRLVGGGYGAGATTLADLAALDPPALPGPFPSRDPWQGLAHLHGLDDVTLILVPDLADLVATRPASLATAAPAIRPPAVFTACSAAAPSTFDGMATPGAPARADAAGVALWCRLVGWAVREAARITPEVMVLAAPPLPADEGPLGEDLPAWLDAIDSGDTPGQLQVAAPWVVGPDAFDLPGRAMPADAALAGLIAAQTLARGAWRSVAGLPVLGVGDLLGCGPADTALSDGRITALVRRAGRIEVGADRTVDREAFAQAHVRRLFASILRAARHRGEHAVFDANGPALWRDVAMSLTTILRRLHGADALQGASEAEAFEVRCGPDTMRQADIDAGRAIAQVRLLPAASLEAIEIGFDVRSGQISAVVAP